MNWGAHSGLRHGGRWTKSGWRNEYLAAENRILKAQLEAPLNSMARRDVEFRALKTAKAIGIELPTSLLLRADEVIE